jgi:hypothetical protein
MGFDLNYANLCLNCNFVDAYQKCPKCQSDQVVPVAYLIGSAPKSKDEPCPYCGGPHWKQNCPEIHTLIMKSN